MAATLAWAGAAGAQTSPFDYGGQARLDLTTQAIAGMSVLGAGWSFDNVPLRSYAPNFLAFTSLRVETTPEAVGCGLCITTQVNFQGSLEIQSTLEPALHFVLTDMALDIASRSLMATVSEGPAGVGTRYAILTGQTLVGSPAFSIRLDQPVYVPLGVGVTDLKLGSSFADLLGQSFTPSAPGVADYVKTLSFGSLTVGTLPIPEPSTYALMGLGLFGAGAVARRRAASRA